MYKKKKGTRIVKTKNRSIKPESNSSSSNLEKSSTDQYRSIKSSEQWKKVEDGFVIFDEEGLSELVSLAQCQNCESKLKLYEDKSARVGLVTNYYFRCTKCDLIINYPKDNWGIKEKEEANFRAFKWFKELGVNEQSIPTFCNLMGLNQAESKSENDPVSLEYLVDKYMKIQN